MIYKLARTLESILKSSEYKRKETLVTYKKQSGNSSGGDGMGGIMRRVKVLIGMDASYKNQRRGIKSKQTSNIIYESLLNDCKIYSQLLYPS